jgi:CheY-like chemotaxis protein
MNLITNAFEAMKKGGQLQIRTSRVCVATELQGYEIIAPGEYVLMQVADSGEGIDEDDLNRIFEPFYSSKEMGRHSGTGLGLSVVHGIVKDHGGFFDVRTEVGAGTVFDLYLPVSVTPVKQENVPSLNTVIGSGDILVVDDEAEQLEMGRQALLRLGYRVATASSGREAVDLFRRRVGGSRAARRGKNPFDLIMLDMVLEEGFDGLDTYREIVDICPGQKCVIVSGQAKNERVAEARALGAGAFLSKPYDIKKLALTVHGALSR